MEYYEYDTRGNRLASHLSTRYEYIRDNALVEDDNYRYEYDRNGNTVRRVDKTDGSVIQYQYDADDHLTNVSIPGDSTLNHSVEIEYRYDPMNRRVATRTDGKERVYLHDRGETLAEYEGTAIATEYTRGAGVDQPLVLRVDANADGRMESFSYHADALGSIRKIVDAEGEVKQEYRYDAFGRVVEMTGDIGQSIAFTGRDWGADESLYYYRARYYDPQIGRFISQDPVGRARGANYYAYVVNNPLLYTDPLGLEPSGVYVCRQSFGGGAAGPLNPIAHHWLCVIDSQGHQSCGSLCPPWYGIGPGRDCGDSFDPKVCKKYDRSDDDLSDCVKQAFDDPRPVFVGIGENCQDWVAQTLYQCGKGGGFFYGQ